MTSIIRFLVERKLLINAVSFFLVALGLYAAFAINREAFPNVNLDVIQIDMAYPGATPEEVEHGVAIVRDKSGPCGYLSILMSKRAEPLTWLPEDLNDNKIINQLVELQASRPGLPVVLEWMGW